MAVKTMASSHISSIQGVLNHIFETLKSSPVTISPQQFMVVLGEVMSRYFVLCDLMKNKGSNQIMHGIAIF